ncbi:MAG TPA: patatin-like phospholipase family protein [Thermoanaerobaculia bacterium]|jgi:NTE family protein|nr:patatin-like phospholipase family protein [Thermoanaerobaculia bacterium]
MSAITDSFALVLTGGGARAAYQVGVLRCLARHLPEDSFDIISGVSAGAINAAFLASRSTPLAEVIEELAEVWRKLEVKDVIRIDARSLARNVFGWGTKLVSGGTEVASRVQGLVDTTPLRQVLERILPSNEKGAIAGIAGNVARCKPRAVSVTALDYTTGQTVTWTDGCDIEMWMRPLRRGVRETLTVDHIMASAALPLVFPAVRLGNHWFGDGGVRLSAPLSPALHLGATRMLAISTHYAKSFSEADEPQIAGYPPPAQILGQLMDAIFLDVMDEDTVRLQRSNDFLLDLPPELRRGYRTVDFTVIRPSQDIGKLAAEYEPRLPRPFRFLTRSLGTRETSNADFMSLFMFVPEYMERLMAIGEADAEARIDDIKRVATAPGGP